MRQLRFGVVVFGALVGCKPAEVAGAVEGTNPGECEDGADNDVDGYFDCDDNNCWGAPVCKDGAGGSGGSGGGVDTDTTGADTDEPTFSGHGIFDNLQSFSMTYMVTFDFDNFGDTICNQYFHSSNCNCSAVYSGHGVLIEAENQRNTYEGEWKLEASNCLVLDDMRVETTDPTFNDGSIWSPKTTTDAYHTFHFKSDKTGIIDWITHSDLSATDRVTTNIMEAEQYWIRATEPHALDEVTWTLHYHEREVKFADLIAVINISDVDYAFSETTTPPELTLPELIIP